MITFKLFGVTRKLLFRINRSLSRTVYGLQYLDCCIKTSPADVNVTGRNMSQKSITSFFNITPKAQKDKKDETTPSPSTPSSNDITPVDSKKGKKRSRSKSMSENESQNERTPSPQTSEKKIRVKRQRIESSESESEKAAETPNDRADIRVAKVNKPKTYESPKNKKSKLIPDNEDENKKIKVENKSPSPKKSPIKDRKKSSGVMSYFTVKREKTEVENKTDFVEKENLNNGQDNTTKKVAEVDYNPAKTKYHPIDDACWSKGQEIPYLALAKTLEAIEATSARLKMVEILSNYFRSVIILTPEDLLPSIYLCLNQLAPAYHSLELGIAETYLMKAIGQCTGRSLAQVRVAARRSGDLGLVAEQARATQRTMVTPAPLAVRRVLAALRDVAALSGHASVNKKINKIQSLYVACRHSEARYLIRSLEGKLRVGLAEQSLLQALGSACAATPPAGDRAGTVDVAATMPADEYKERVDEHALTIKTTYCECPNYELLVPALLQHGVRALPQHCRLTPGIPLKPMLAHPTKGVHEVFSRFENEEFTCEWKYDGERAQIHVPGDDEPRVHDARVYSRNQEDNTSKYPDVLQRLPALLRPTVTSCVLDCEAVAYDPATKQILPFQVLSTRKRKDARADDVRVQVCVFVFDLLYLNGRPLVRAPLLERRELLREHFLEVEGQWQFAAGRDCRSDEEVQQFLQQAVRGSCEGLMVKALRGARARYDIARRSHNWLKIKKDYLEGVGDTIDTVVIGAYSGRGRRAGVFGGFLLACYDPDTEHYQSLCKIGTGFSDEQLRTLSDQLLQHRIDGPRNYYMYDAAHSPDAWFGAACVWEVRCADLSLSPAHRAALGLVDPERGVSLRFPRFVRVRADKGAEQATSARQLARLYAAQDQVRNAARAPPADDFY